MGILTWLEASYGVYYCKLYKVYGQNGANGTILGGKPAGQLGWSKRVTLVTELMQERSLA